MAGHVFNPSTKFDYPLLSLTYDVSHWLPLTIIYNHCTCTRSWLVNRDHIYIFGIPDPYLPISLCNFYGAMMMINGHYVCEQKFLIPLKSGPNMAVFREKGGLNINLWFWNPKRHVLVQNRVFWRIFRINRCGRLGCRRLEEPKN